MNVCLAKIPASAVQSSDQRLEREIILVRTLIVTNQVSARRKYGGKQAGGLIVFSVCSSSEDHNQYRESQSDLVYSICLYQRVCGDMRQ